MQLRDSQIVGVIRELDARGDRVSGAAVRAELARRFGARGGVARVYRLLHAQRQGFRHEESANLAERVRVLEAQLAAMTERAERAEYRELVHQDRAAIEIHNLREKLRQLQMAPRVEGVQHEQFMRAYREVIALRKRVAELESLGQGARQQTRTTQTFPHFLERQRQAIEGVCRRHEVLELAFFGSVLTADFDASGQGASDVDATVRFGPVTGIPTARTFLDFKTALETTLQRSVDLVEFDAMPDSRLKRIIASSRRQFFSSAGL